MKQISFYFIFLLLIYIFLLWSIQFALSNKFFQFIRVSKQAAFTANHRNYKKHIQSYYLKNILFIISYYISVINIMDKQELKLATKLKFWYQYQPIKQKFNQSLVPVAVVDTVQKFWTVYQHCKRPSKHQDNSYFYLFKENVKPVWQDPQNHKGGAFVLRFYKDKCDKVWEDLVLALVGNSVGEFSMINGIRSKVKKQSQIVEVWVSRVQNQQELERVREWIIKATCLNQDTNIEFITFHTD